MRTALFTVLLVRLTAMAFVAAAISNKEHVAANLLLRLQRPLRCVSLGHQRCHPPLNILCAVCLQVLAITCSNVANASNQVASGEGGLKAQSRLRTRQSAIDFVMPICMAFRYIRGHTLWQLYQAPALVLQASILIDDPSWSTAGTCCPRAWSAGCQ